MAQLVNDATGSVIPVKTIRRQRLAVNSLPACFREGQQPNARDLLSFIGKRDGSSRPDSHYTLTLYGDLPGTFVILDKDADDVHLILRVTPFDSMSPTQLKECEVLAQFFTRMSKVMYPVTNNKAHQGVRKIKRTFLRFRLFRHSWFTAEQTTGEMYSIGWRTASEKGLVAGTYKADLKLAKSQEEAQQLLQDFEALYCALPSIGVRVDALTSVPY